MKKLIALALIITTFQAYAQLAEKIRRELVVPGSIIKNGQTISGYIAIPSELGIPLGPKFIPEWRFQREIRFLEKSKFESSATLKDKDYEKLEPRDIQGYSYNHDSLVYESCKYADLTAVGTDMMPTWKFMRVISKNRITIYHHFQRPTVDLDENDIFASAVEPELVFKKDGDGKLKLVGPTSMKKVFSDCPKILAKLESKEYTKIADERRENGDKNRFIRELLIFEDYNNGICK